MYHQYRGAPGCSATLTGNALIDYFSLFVNERMLQHIVEQTILNSKQFMESHTLGQHSRIQQWLKEEHTITELRRFLALTIVIGIIRHIFSDLTRVEACAKVCAEQLTFSQLIAGM